MVKRITSREDEEEHWKWVDRQAKYLAWGYLIGAVILLIIFLTTGGNE